jgi:two-component system CheB/CheR fusion protein
VRVVGIGASAGGIKAFRLFFEIMPPDSGMGFVIVLHMSADRKSILPEILARWTTMPVAEAADGNLIEANRVYVIPPGHIGTLRGGRLRLRHLAPEVPREAAPIDEFFDSLAADLSEGAIGIVLSGTGHDGALGLKAIRARGGLTLAQGMDGSAPQHSGMPASAIATGTVDLIVPVQDMPGLIVRIKERQEAAARAAPAAAWQTDPLRRSICEILFARVGHDFSGYKEATFLRRVQRRMQVLGLSGLPSYVVRLEEDREEAKLLFRDLLIGVTMFFRDASAFAAMRQVVVPRLFEGKGAGDQVRVWVPGCATGEEAYSLAILLREHLDGLSDAPKVQVFATDIDERAIGTARAGHYPATLLDGLSPERLDRFFARQGNSYVVGKEIRDLCMFSAHSLVRDPPFSRMNLVSCRNLLIYMDVELQAAVIPAFHYSLVPGGVLLLGSAETVARHDGLFTPLEKEHRIFLRRDGPSLPLKLPSHSAPRAHSASAGPAPDQEKRTNRLRSVAVANSRVLERFASPFVVVTEDGAVLQYSSHAGGFLLPALGSPSRSLFDMARRSLRRPLRGALRDAAETGRTVERAVQGDADGAGAVTLVVEPLPGQEPDRLYLIVFKENGSARSGPPSAGSDGSSADEVAAEVERELRETREQLQSLIEEHETALEELRSSNEELHSVNEELQSSNEELETSKEEIQSVNEELHTVNAQLSMKVDELDRANSDLRNLFESTRVATVFLDQHMIIRAFTPEVASIYNLIPSDRGQPLTDIVSRLDYDGLRENVEQVLRTLEPLERRVSRRDGTAHYLLRILPYRTPESAVDGSLITFVDVTQIVEAEQHQRLLVQELNHRVKNMLTVVISLATQTLRRAGTLEEFSGVFLGRVHALTAAYSLLSRESWSAVRLDEIVAEELRPFIAGDRTNVVITGRAVLLDPRGALALGMAVHELATNAAKYGALSVPEGDVFVTWDVERTEDGEHLLLDWVERNGPPVKEPAKRGVGSMLIERALGHDLSGKSKIEFRPEGVRAVIRAPLPTNANDPAAATADQG